MSTRQAEADFRAFVEDVDFPCLAGKGVVHQDALTFGSYDAIGAESSTRRLAEDLSEFVAKYDDDSQGFSAFVAVFDGPVPESEDAFEHLLWLQLQSLSDSDSSQWDATVSDDPDDARFAFSFAGRAFFVIGLHPHSSRLARRFSQVAVVFNPHVQFDRLREDGRFYPLREAIRERDIALQGSINPNLTDFGETSEARQYSGRATGDAWRCPFHHNESQEQRANE